MCVQSSGKWTKCHALPELIWWLPELIFQFFTVLIFFSDDLYKCLLAAAASHVSDSATVFVTCSALLHWLLFITLIPHFNRHFVMYSVSTMTTDNWNERNKCYHLPSRFAFADNWLNPTTKMEIGKWDLALNVEAGESRPKKRHFIKNLYEGDRRTLACSSVHVVTITTCPGIWWCGLTKDWRRHPSFNLTLT